MKFALGWFHFNVQYVAGQEEIYHRYCTEAIGPFLDAVDRKANWCVSMEMAGNGLEFLDRYYPSLTGLMRKLIIAGRLELNSSMYVPAIWPAFPRRDLIKSIELNRKCLEQLKMPVSRIFFAHESFFGVGACTLTDYFDAVVCKDDYLSYFVEPREILPAYRVGEMLVIVGSNHLINELYRRSAGGGESSLSPAQEATVKRAADVLPHCSSPVFNVGGTEWFWYHMGSGHNYSTWGRPEDSDQFFFDADWNARIEAMLSSISADGWRFTTVGNLCQNMKDVNASLPAVVEASWNAARSQGVFAWMGRHYNSWEDDVNVLGASWKSRNRLIQCERAVAAIADSTVRSQLESRFDDLWKMQLLSESSDSLGWTPRPKEVTFSRDASNEVLRGVAAIQDKLREFQLPIAVDKGCACFPNNGSNIIPFAEFELFGCEGSARVGQVSKEMQIVETWFHGTSSKFGIRFLTFPPALVYCPSGMESAPLRLEWPDLLPDVVFLPLSNGLLMLAADLFLIRVNQYGQPAACVDAESRSVSFQVEGPSRLMNYRWRFFLFRGMIEEAVRRANEYNYAE